MARPIDCKKCLHEKVCALWTRQESQDASCFCQDGCDYFAPTLTPSNEWVSVEERLPDAEKEVRLFCVTPNGYKYQCQGFYVPPGMRRDDSDYSWDWECCDQYDEDSDDYFVNPGWYESSHNWDEYSAFGIADKVTYWMPLPEPPGKEG